MNIFTIHANLTSGNMVFCVCKFHASFVNSVRYKYIFLWRESIVAEDQRGASLSICLDLG